MNVMWRFLRGKRNQQVLGWLGGGLVVAGTGLWAFLSISFLLGNLLKQNPQSRRYPASSQTVVALPSAAM